jgi:hypothetical protein
MKKNKMYQPPVLKVVAFTVENGFLSSPGTSTSSGVNFGGTLESGIITDDPGTNKSGLNQYGYDGLFDRTNNPY